MSIDPKAPIPQPSDDKTAKTDKVADLPTRDASGKDDQVKGGRMPLKPR
ncbi:MAG: hypothetical protein ABI664_08550 [bacterium]